MTQGGKIRFYESEEGDGVKVCVCVSTWHGNLRARLCQGANAPAPLNKALA